MGSRHFSERIAKDVSSRLLSRRKGILGVALESALALEELHGNGIAIWSHVGVLDMARYLLSTKIHCIFVFYRPRLLRRVASMISPNVCHSILH